MSDLGNASAASRQLVLDLGRDAAAGVENFVRGAGNCAAMDLLARWPDWSHTTVILVGPPAAGKSHLANILAARAGGQIVQASRLTLDDVDQFTCPLLVVENADQGVAEEAALFHLINQMAQNGGSLLVTARQRPTAWQLSLADLASRLRAAGLVEIEAPDEALLGAVLAKQFADRQIDVGKPVLDYILARMERSFAAAQALVAAIDALSLEESRAITVPLVARVIAQPAGNRPTEPKTL
ncbi:MAG: HdaA/DnaA family protein [Alphaproteobacteria bacterium]